MEEEIDRLKAVQRVLKNKMKITQDFDERDMLQQQVDQIEKQIEMIARFKTR